MRRTRWIVWGSCLATAGALAACAVEPATPDTGVHEDAINGGINDDDTPQANVVVKLAYIGTDGQGYGCTGTLISPAAVLTAKHCVAGSTNAYGNAPAAVLPIQVTVGNPQTSPRAVTRNASAPTVYFGNMSRVSTDELGGDLAILWLDQPVFDLDLDIRRPSLTAPTLSGDDSEGGVYPQLFGMVGWSPRSNHDPNFRQVGWFNEIYHYPGWPDEPAGQIWVRTEGWLHTEPGDSGGPIYQDAPGGGRDVIGVLSGSGNLDVDGLDCLVTTCNWWTDITRGGPANWVREQMVDDRSSIWRIRHGVTSHWRGEVEYAGACRYDRDADCDHWFDAHDNCPATPNWGQEDGDDDGLGDACQTERPFAPWKVFGWGNYFGEMAAAKDVRGVLHFFGRRGDYAVIEAVDQPSIQELGTPSELGGLAWYRPGAAQNADGRAEVFMATDDLFNKWEYYTSTGTAWSWGWNDLGQRATSSPAAITAADGSLEVFVRGAAGDVVHARQWWGWQAESLGGGIQGAPAVGRNADGRLEVFVRGTDNAIYNDWQLYPNGPWSGWSPLGGYLTSDPVVAHLPGGELQVFARGGDGAIWTRVQTISGWSGWHSLGGWTPGTPAVALANTGLAVFVRGGDNHVYRNLRVLNQPFQWQGWQDLGGYTYTDPVVGQRSDGGLIIVTSDLQGNLHDLRQD